MINEKLTCNGLNIEMMTKEQLLVSIRELYRDYKYFFDLYQKSQETTIGLMEDMVKLKFKK